MSLFQVVILVCAMTMPRGDCQPDTALDVIRGPDAQNELMCGFHGQAYLASSAIGRRLRTDEYVKIKCTRTGIGVANVG
jgi:hypothetical protein